MLRWASRCLPGFSIILLLILMLFAFSDSFQLPSWGIFPPQQPPSPPPTTGSPAPLNLAQKIFVVYAILIHFNMFAFTCRLCWSFCGLVKDTKVALERRIWWRSPRTSSDSAPSSSSSDDGFSPIASPTKKYPDANVFQLDDRTVSERDQSVPDEPEITHAIILPNYSEDIHTLRASLSVLASHPRAHSQYKIYLAMEQKEAGAAEKAAKLVSAFEKSFVSVETTFHPAGIPGEIAGKSSNVSFAARHIIETHRAELYGNTCNVIVTVMDADTHLTQDYFLEIRRLHFAHITEAERSFYSCPIIFDRNSDRTPLLVRCADLMWSFAGISTMYPGTPISIPTSVYSLPLSLAEKVGGWDSDPTSIGEDMHMMLKCYFETAGNVIPRVVHIPASQCNISSEDHRGWRRTLDTCNARYNQALRHMWGALDTGYAVRCTANTLRSKRRFFFFRLRHIALVHLLWEAHFLPCHLTILLIFSVVYTVSHPVSSLHPTLAWMFWVTDMLRTGSFLLMNINLSLYDRWYKMCLNARRQDMVQSNLPECGFAPRSCWSLQQMAERICFPIAGTLYGAVPTLQAVFSHFWTDRLVYLVSKKPTFAPSATSIV